VQVGLGDVSLIEAAKGPVRPLVAKTRFAFWFAILVSILPRLHGLPSVGLCSPDTCMNGEYL
jgi:hypothetical protein